MEVPIRVLVVGGSFARVCVARDMKKRFLVSMVFARPRVPDSRLSDAHLCMEIIFTVPVGNVITVGVKRFRHAEVLF